MTRPIQLLTGTLIILAMSCLIAYQQGFDHGRKARADDVIFDYCATGHVIQYGRDQYTIVCLLRNP